MRSLARFNLTSGKRTQITNDELKSILNNLTLQGLINYIAAYRENQNNYELSFEDFSSFPKVLVKIINFYNGDIERLKSELNEYLIEEDYFNINYNPEIEEVEE
ncbi:hypothetical protein HMPREF9709_01207 [Helcococcus kunzii ATCC 51366]|uniref:Uncharacterized protein n=1 Tax=Helcococcus kunzii ATCC 51366 TaxID=883114 RepID=H3NPE6_9FIRM|nr:hypothetical protein [Helcococcus kunzii]EHR33459.1 hypothetical protein HMPREF9709_01207 [Helcococcus kunzii ATCC 51366]